MGARCLAGLASGYEWAVAEVGSALAGLETRSGTV